MNKENQNPTNYWLKPEEGKRIAKLYGYANFPNEPGKSYHANLSTQIPEEGEDVKTDEHMEQHPELWDALDHNSYIIISAPPYQVEGFPLELLKNIANTLNEAYASVSDQIAEWELEHGNLGTIKGNDYSNTDRTGVEFNSAWLAEAMGDKLGDGISGFIAYLSHIAGLNKIEKRVISKGEADRIATEWAGLPRQGD